MDKMAARELFSYRGFPICRYIPVMAEEVENGIDSLINKIDDEFEGKYPVFVKPSNMGSSVGISKVKSRQGLTGALKTAARYDRRLLIEEGIDGRELETAILGNRHKEAAVVGEILPSREFYDYDAKYLDGGKSKILIPADVPEHISEQIREMGINAYEALDCAGYARVDFFLENETDNVYLSEINTIPGFTRFSMFPLLWKAAGLGYTELLERIVNLGYERYYAKNNRQTTEL
jgi:D-alanine-D-alanine ligase